MTDINLPSAPPMGSTIREIHPERPRDLARRSRSNHPDGAGANARTDGAIVLNLVSPSLPAALSPARRSRSRRAHIRMLLTQRRVIDHGRRTTSACRREM
ncbi:hypothetical protein GCM10023222_03130 [Saccharopolyspora cebuensis]